VARQAIKARAEDFEDAAALLGTLDCLRSAITILDSSGRLIHVNAHLNYLFRSFPPRGTLIGKGYQELIRLEIEGGEIAPEAQTMAMAWRRKTWRASRSRSNMPAPPKPPSIPKVRAWA
jgi:hypothetical protein